MSFEQVGLSGHTIGPDRTFYKDGLQTNLLDEITQLTRNYTYLELENIVVILFTESETVKSCEEFIHAIHRTLRE